MTTIRGMTSTDRLADWITLVDASYPEREAQGWDATGVQVGAPDDEVRTVMVTLDVTDAVLDEAAGAGADLIIAHHPLLFRPLERLTPDTAAGRLALRAARQGCAIVAAHTNFDAASPGTTDPVTDALGLTDVRPLQTLPAEDLGTVKLVVFVPQEDTDAVLAAISDAGGGRIGEYDQCSFRTTGTGTFRPSAAANPAVGARGERNEVVEDRLEVIVPQGLLGRVVEAMTEAHPYEEVAHDLIPLTAAPPERGIGRIGTLPAAESLRDLADRLAVALDTRHLRVVGDLERRVRRVAACGGAGDGLIGVALAAGADLYVTGDLRHHPALDAATQGLALIDAGHWATEAPALSALTDTLAETAAAGGLRARLLASRTRTEPWADYTPPLT